MSKESKEARKLKEGVKFKTKPAMVPKRRKMKSSRSKMPIAAMMPKGITKWNIIFSALFGALLVLTIIQGYFYDFFLIPLPDLIMQFVVPVVLVIEVFLVVLAFEAKAFKFPKIHTRHSVKRILIVGSIIGILLVSFFTPYAKLVGKYRDLPPGVIDPQDVDPSWFQSLFTGSAPFYIDGLLDLLDALDLNDTLADQDIAEIEALGGSTLGDFLYRWDIKDRYESGTWEFVESNPGTRFDLVDPDNYVPPTTISDPNVTRVEEYRVTQTVYSVTTALLMNVISTFSNNYNKPYLDYDSIQVNDDWDDNFADENGSIIYAAEDSASVEYNFRDMFSLQATMPELGFVGDFIYDSFFIGDGNITDIIAKSGDYGAAPYVSSAFNTTFARFLQTPANYETFSPGVIDFAYNTSSTGIDNSASYYTQITYILENILSTFGAPTSADSDNEGNDRAQLLVDRTDFSLSAYLTLAIMNLRLNGIPCRPVFGFAIGNDIGPNHKMLELDNFYAWIEALIPIEIGGETFYKWGQFQMGPYYDGSDFIYAENTLYSSYDVDVEILREPPLYLPVSRQDLGGGQEVYITDYATTYTLRTTVSDVSGFVDGVNVFYETVSVADLQTYQSNPAALLAAARNIGDEATSGGGVAELLYEWNATDYDVYNPSFSEDTSYVLIVYVTLASMNFTGFVLVPEGYLSIPGMNASVESIPNPNPPPIGTFDFYMVQRGVNYELSSTLYDDPGHTTPLNNRLVTYYALDQTQVDLIIADPNNLASMIPVGSAYTNTSGISTFQTIEGSIDHFVRLGLVLDTTYYIAAVYGQNYTYHLSQYMDTIKSTIDINDTYHNKVTDGDTFWVGFDFYLYQEPPGSPAEALPNENIDIYFVLEAHYTAANKTSQQALRDDIEITYGYSTLDTDVTDGNGIFNATYNIDVTGLAVGFYVFLVLYVTHWNVSESISIASPPVSMSMNVVEDSPSEFGNQNYIFDLEKIIYVSLTKTSYVRI